MLDRHSLAYVPTAVLAPRVMPLLASRERLGVQSCAYSLVKLIDPFHGDGYRVVSVTHSAHLARMREFLVATRARALLKSDPAFDGAEILDDVAVVSVVGAGLTDTTEPLVRMFDCLGGEGVEPLEVRASPLRLRAIVPASAAARAQRALHARFVGV